MYKEIELYYEPLKIFDKMPQYKEFCEMSEFEQSFLCGLLKDKKPKKVLEIGVSAGGTTAVILNCCSMIGQEVDVYSVDLSDAWYRDNSRKTGFVAERAKKYIEPCIHHSILTGKYAPEFFNVIGNEIDFLILDTSHILPGEILDFLAVYPLLAEDAVVVLHDITLNWYRKNDRAYVTKILFDVVTAEKYLMKDAKRLFDIPNIAAFTVNNKTGENIQDVFSSLSITWERMISKEQYLIYRKQYQKYYSEDMLELFDKVLEAQKWIVCRRYKGEQFDYCIEECKRAKKIYIYGYGSIGIIFEELLQILGINVEAYVISDDLEKNDIQNTEKTPIITLNDLKNKEDLATVVMTIRNATARMEVEKELQNIDHIKVI